MQAYLQTASTNPDAALVGTGWVDPTNGQLINGQSNNCVPGSLSMDNVVQLVHSKGGMAYLTITMETDGTASAWTSQQQSDYIATATTNQSYIDVIVHEVIRANYDGVIMDMEAGDANYPNIQQLFAEYNQRVWAALKPLHKFYGIALIHKLSDHDDYYHLNAFENWSLLGHDNDEVSIMSEERPVLESVEMIVVVVVAEFVNERDAIKFMQRLQCSPDALIVFSEELLDIWIVSVTGFHIHNDPIVVGSYNLVYDHINITLVGCSCSDVV